MVLHNVTDSLVNWSVHDVASEQSDEDDCVTDEGSIDKHNVVTIIEFIQAVVVQDHARDGDDLEKSTKNWIKFMVIVESLIAN